MKFFSICLFSFVFANLAISDSLILKDLEEFTKKFVRSNLDSDNPSQRHHPFGDFPLEEFSKKVEEEYLRNPSILEDFTQKLKTPVTGIELFYYRKVLGYFLMYSIIDKAVKNEVDIEIPSELIDAVFYVLRTTHELPENETDSSMKITLVNEVPSLERIFTEILADVFLMGRNEAKIRKRILDALADPERDSEAHIARKMSAFALWRIFLMNREMDFDQALVEALAVVLDLEDTTEEVELAKFNVIRVIGDKLAVDPSFIDENPELKLKLIAILNSKNETHEASTNRFLAFSILSTRDLIVIDSSLESGLVNMLSLPSDERAAHESREAVAVELIKIKKSDPDYVLSNELIKALVGVVKIENEESSSSHELLSAKEKSLSVLLETLGDESAQKNWTDDLKVAVLEAVFLPFSEYVANSENEKTLKSALEMLSILLMSEGTQQQAYKLLQGLAEQEATTPFAQRFIESKVKPVIDVFEAGKKSGCLGPLKGIGRSKGVDIS